MTDLQRDALLIALAQVAVQVLYRMDGMPAHERGLYSMFVADALTAAGANAYPDELS